MLKRLGKDSYLFKFGHKRSALDKSRSSLMARLCSTFPELNELRVIKMRAEKIYDSSKDQFEAVQNINDFVKNIPPGSEYRDFRKFARTLKNWMPEVLNYFKYGLQYTNAATEGVNSLIKSLNSVGRGYSFEVLRAKSLYWSKAHKGPTKARKKPNMNIDPNSRKFAGFVDPDDFYGKEYYVTGDMSDIDTLLDHIEEIL